MLLAAMRDMQWRKRRFVIAVLSTAIIFAMTLVLTGLANGFRAEAQRTVDALGVDVFLVKDGASGPFVGATPFAPTDLGRIAASPGVQAAAPLVYAGGTVTLGDATRNADLFGAPERGPGMPVLSQGRPPANPDEVAVSSTLDRNEGEDIQIASRRLRIVGIVENSTALANLPNIFLTTQGAQQLVYGGQPLVASIGIQRHARPGAAGYKAIDRDGAVADLLRPLKVAVNSITIVAILLWVVAALIVGSVIYLSALERMRDFAVYKAIGVPTGSIAAGLALQAVVVALSRRRRRRRALARCWHRSSRCRSSSRGYAYVIAARGRDRHRPDRQRSPVCTARWPSIRPWRSEVREPWAISAFRIWSSSTPAADTPSGRSTGSTSTWRPARW